MRVVRGIGRGLAWIAVGYLGLCVTVIAFGIAASVVYFIGYALSLWR